MEIALAEAVAAELSEHKDVLKTDVDSGSPEASVIAYVPDRHSKGRVKRDLHKYPLYVELVIQDE